MEHCGNCKHRHELILWNKQNEFGAYRPNYEDKAYCCTAIIEQVHQSLSEDGMCELWERREG